MGIPVVRNFCLGWAFFKVFNFGTTDSKEYLWGLGRYSDHEHGEGTQTEARQFSYIWAGAPSISACLANSATSALWPPVGTELTQ